MKKILYVIRSVLLNFNNIRIIKLHNIKSKIQNEALDIATYQEMYGYRFPKMIGKHGSVIADGEFFYECLFWRFYQIIGKDKIE